MLGTTSAPHRSAFGRFAGAASAVILFGAVLLFAIIVSLRYAHGWVGALSDGATVAAPMTADAIAGLASMVVTGVGIVWLYVKRLAG
jgi:hypothetical protein